MDRLRMALIGAGRRGTAHLKVLATMTDHFEIVAVCDARPEAAQAAAASVNARPYTSLRAMLEQEQPDLCDVVTPLDSHHSISWFLSTHGISHILETPLAATLPLADFIIETARRYNVHVEVAESVYREPESRLMALVGGSGVIGRVGRVIQYQGSPDYHGMSHLRMLIGNPRPLSVQTIAHTMPVQPYVDNAGRRQSNETFTASFLSFDNGVFALAAMANWKNGLGRLPRPGYLEIQGTRGAIARGEVRVVPADAFQSGANATTYPFRRHYHTVDGHSVLTSIAVDTPDGAIQYVNPFPSYALTSDVAISIAAELDSLARAVWQNTEPDYGLALAREDYEMLLAALESAERGGKVLTLPLTAPTRAEERALQRITNEAATDPLDVERLLEVAFPWM